MTRYLRSVLWSAVLIVAMAGVARAQTEPPPASSPPGSSSRGGGSHGMIGVGGIAYLSNVAAGVPTGLSLAYDPGMWHLDTMLAISGTDPNRLAIGGRFWYHLNATSASDLSIGAGASYDRIGGQNGAPSVNDLFIELGGMIRIFLVQNVALGGAAGIVIGTADATGFAIGPTNLVGSASLHYFF